MEAANDLERAVQTIAAAAAEVESFCHDFSKLSPGYGYLTDGPSRNIPAELGLTDLFMCALVAYGGRGADATLVSLVSRFLLLVGLSTQPCICRNGLNLSLWKDMTS